MTVADTEDTPGPVRRPPLRKFIVRTLLPASSPSADGDVFHEDHEVVAHLVFDNANRGEGLVFRRYYDNDVRTEKVAEFQIGTWQFYKEIPNG